MIADSAHSPVLTEIDDTLLVFLRDILECLLVQVYVVHCLLADLLEKLLRLAHRHRWVRVRPTISLTLVVEYHHILVTEIFILHRTTRKFYSPRCLGGLLLRFNIFDWARLVHDIEELGAIVVKLGGGIADPTDVAMRPKALIILTLLRRILVPERPLIVNDILIEVVPVKINEELILFFALRCRVADIILVRI